MNRKFLLAAALLTAVCFNAGAQAMKSFQAKIAASRVSFDYSLQTSGKTPFTASGHVLLQGDSFYMEGNGLNVWCDGKSMATMDKAAKEVYTEMVSDGDVDTNPAMLVNSLGKSFKVKSETAGKYDGTSVTVVTLVPAGKSDISSATVYIAPGDVIKALTFKTSAGDATAIKISSLKYEAKKQDLSVFRLDKSRIPKDYVVTEL